ncbi:hypothetical protein [Poriferisphaera sp. WC338]|uniref:hypothetical protein n=1 Tax=Poriferisphaera sp. WC338 TaxID=3425129 RepID=UPI003D8167A8
MINNIQLRGIVQSLVLWGQGNKGYYPGFDSEGDVVAASVEERLQILLEGNYFTSEYVIAPVDTKAEWTTGALTTANYSYAMLDIDGPTGSGRAQEWRETANINAVVLSDRNIGENSTGNVKSIHTDTLGEWFGSVAYNDSHVEYENTHILETGYGRKKSAAVDGEVEFMSEFVFDQDNLFTEDTRTGDDAFMIYSGK